MRRRRRHKAGEREELTPGLIAASLCMHPFMGLPPTPSTSRRTARSFSGSYPTIVADWGGMPCSFTLMMGLPAFAADAMTW
jgi:hypothetical protein